MAVDVLIAEDEPSILESLDFILRRAGFSIASVTDGEAALVAAVATLTGMRIGVTLWGRSHLAKFVTATAPLWDGERARLEALRNPLDPSAKEPCGSPPNAAS